MNIHIGTSAGKGETELSAFDTALFNAGIANYNLIYLSSVIPPKSDLILHDGGIKVELPGTWGDKLYVVMAQKRTSVHGEMVSAGVGWVQDPKTKKGLFVEHEGHSPDEVAELIRRSLKTLMKTRDIDFGEIHMKVVSEVCDSLPVCAMAVAVYQNETWSS